VTELGEDNERYAYPPLLNSVGFFEDYFDGKPEAVATFWRVMNRRLSDAAWKWARSPIQDTTKRRTLET
jgi:hypothetical protein